MFGISTFLCILAVLTFKTSNIDGRNTWRVRRSISAVLAPGLNFLLKRRPNGTVTMTYRYASSELKEILENTIREAMGKIEDKTCIRFEETDESSADIDFTSERGKDGNCYAYRDIEPYYTVSSSGHIYRELIKKGAVIGLLGCIDKPDFLHAAMHELLHALGLGHEHQRADRLDYIKFKDPSTSNDDGFKIDRRLLQLYLPYDYNSVIHYNGFFNVIDDRFDCNTAQPNLTSLDVYKINLLYKCPGERFYEIPKPNCGQEESCLCTLRVDAPTNITSNVIGLTGETQSCFDRCEKEEEAAVKHLRLIYNTTYPIIVRNGNYSTGLI